MNSSALIRRSSSVAARRFSSDVKLTAAPSTLPKFTLRTGDKLPAIGMGTFTGTRLTAQARESVPRHCPNSSPNSVRTAAQTLPEQQPRHRPNSSPDTVRTAAAAGGWQRSGLVTGSRDAAGTHHTVPIASSTAQRLAP